MFNKPERCVVFFLTMISLSGCSYLENNDHDNLSVSSTEPITMDTKACRTFGFRNWSLQRDDATITLGAQAMMPTPAWSVVLHNSGISNSSAIEFTVETIEPSAPSSSVVSWVTFETTMNIETSKSVEVSVKCAGEPVWNSQSS